MVWWIPKKKKTKKITEKYNEWEHLNKLKPIWILNGWSWLCVIIIVSGMLRNKQPKRKIPSPPIRFPGNLGIENDLEGENILM